MKKFELTSTTKMVFGRTLYQIKASMSFGTVSEGELGGWIEKEGNLSQDGNAWVSGNAEVSGDARVYDNAMVYGNAEVSGNAMVYGDAWVSGNARVYGNAWFYGNAWVYDNARVYGDAWVYGNAEVSGNADVSGDADVLWISKIGSRLGTTTFFKTKKGIEVSCGCFLGTIEEFESKVNATHGDSKHGEVYRHAIEIAKLQIGG